MFVPVVRDSFADNYARIIDSLCHGENLETALRKIAEAYSGQTLAIHKKECVLRVVAGGRRTDDHSGRIRTLPANTESKCSQTHPEFSNR
jgi:hypothetical protein